MRRLITGLLLLTLLLAACAPGGAAPLDPVPNGQVLLDQANAALPAQAEATTVPDTAAEAQLPAEPPASCPVTKEPAPSLEQANAPHDGVPYPGQFWYGHDGLWTDLPQSGVWAALPHDSHGYGNKLFFWHRDYDWDVEPEPPLTITGRRLGAEAGPLEVPPPTNGQTDDLGMFMLSGANFPTAGCWEVTASYHEATLSYVIWIAP